MLVTQKSLTPTFSNQAFQLFDDDGSGKINIKACAARPVLVLVAALNTSSHHGGCAQNMRRVARELGENLSEDELQVAASFLARVRTYARESTTPRVALSRPRRQ